MDTQTIGQLVLLIVLIMLSAFFSASETALTSVSKLRIRHLSREHVKNAGKVLKLLDDPNRLLGAILVGNNIVNIGASALATSLALKHFGSAGVGIATGIMTLLVLVFGEITPKSWAVDHAESLSLRIAGLIGFLIVITGPILVLLLYITNFLIRLTGGAAKGKKTIITPEELRSLVDVSHEEGILEGEEHRMIHNVLEFGDLPVRSVMTPRTDMVAVSEAISFAELRELFRTKGYSRIPVYAGSMDQVTGIIHLRDLLFAEGEGDFNLAALTRPPYFTYEFIRVRELFEELRTRRTSLAVVLDEYGGTVGIITMEDLIEEILGELAHSQPEDSLEFIQVLTDGYLVGGSTRIDEINQLLGTRIRGDEFDTIAGFLIFEMGNLPEPGDALLYQDLRFRVDEIRDKRIRRIHISRSSPSDSSPDRKPTIDPDR